MTHRSRVMLILVVACAVSVRGQSTFGSILGSVLDPSGAAVTGAAVTIKELDTGISIHAVSGGNGLYELLNVKPGRYSVTATKAGFADSVATAMELESRRTIRADLELRFPDVRESVTVRAADVAINTEDGTIADTKNFAQITQLPLNFRGTGTNPASLLSAVPGVQQDAINHPSIGGGLPTQVEYSIDGITTVHAFSGPLVDIYPSPEALAEFRVTSVNANAEFGQMSDVSVITRGGTNQIHGSLFWFHQNAAMDAKTYGGATKQAKVSNTSGGSLGGPVTLPGLYRGKSRTFFFVDYEGNRRHRSTLRQASVPAAEMWRGNLTGVPGPAAVDPLNSQLFPGKTIPATRINSVATNLSGFYPLPNSNSGSTTNNYRVLLPNVTDTDGYDIRADHAVSSRQQVFARWSWRASGFPSGLSGVLPPAQRVVRNGNLVLAHNFAFRPKLVNEVRVGLTRFRDAEVFPIRGGDAVAKLGIQGLDLSRVQNGGGFPFFSFSDGTGFTSVLHGRDGASGSNAIQFTDNLTWVQGRHTWKFGVDVRRLDYQSVLHIGDNDEFGGFFFNQRQFSGNAFANLLLGLPGQTEVAVVGPNVRQRSNHLHFYAQNRWQASRRLTFTLGLRWEIHPPMTEDAGNITNFDQATGNVIIPDRSLPVAPSFLTSSNACPGTTPAYPCTEIVNASQLGLGAGLRKTRYGNITPRFGFAYRPFPGNHTVMRGGFGIYTNTVPLPQAYGGKFLLDPPGNAFLATGINPTYRDPSSYQWNFTLEHMLDPQRSVRLSYIGVQSVGLTQQVDLNQVPAGKAPYSRSRTPYPVWTSVVSLENIGFANYQGLQSVVSQRFRKGIFFQAAYTLAKSIGNAEGPTGGFGGMPIFFGEYAVKVPTDRFNTRLDRGELTASRRHRFVLSGIFPLPVGRGRTIGGRFHGLAETLAGGWELSTITLLESGPMQTPITGLGFDQSNTNVFRVYSTARPDRIGNGNLANQTRDRFYDITAFAQAPAGAGRFGNSGVGILRGPHLTAVAAGLSKTFSIAEKMRLRLEGTFTNLPNHPNFQAPAVTVSTPSNFGKLTAVQSAENSGNRTGQAGLRLEF